MEHRCISTAFLTLIAVIGSASIAFSSPMVDQSNTGTPAFIAGGVPAVFAQTFTVGTSGQLTGFDLRLMRINSVADTGNFIVQLRDTIGGIPTPRLSTPLAQLADSDMILPAQSLGDFSYIGLTHFNISSSNISVHAGDVLAIDIFGTAGTDENDGFIISGTSDAYPGGTEYDGFLDQTAWDIGSQDLAFQTYVDPSVPEPLSLSIVGFALLFSRVGRS